MDEAGVALNGSAKKRELTALSLLFGACVLSTVMLAAWTSVHVPAEWDLVNKVIDHLAQMDLLLGGALVGSSKHE